MKVEESSMYDAIKQVLISDHDRQKSKEVIYRTPFYCYNYQQNPTYVSDGTFCIQAIYPSFDKTWDCASPINNVRTPFYCGFKDSFKVFNCPPQMLEEKCQLNEEDEAQQKEHQENQENQKKFPYHPAFYFGDKMDQYKKNRTFIQNKKDMGMCLVSEWKLHVINIGKSPYYGIVLELVQYQVIRKTKQYLLNIPTSILFDEFVRTTMVRMKVQDLRKYYHDKTKNIVHHPFKIYEMRRQAEAASKTVYLKASSQKLNLKANTMESQANQAYVYMGVPLIKSRLYFLKNQVPKAFFESGNHSLPQQVQVTAQKIVTQAPEQQISKQQISKPVFVPQQQKYYELLDSDEQEEVREEEAPQQEEEEEELNQDLFTILYKRMLAKQRRM